MNSILIKNVKKHTINLLKNSRCKSLAFHNVKHTLEVFKNVQIIAENENINASDLEILKIAALFHDTGIIETFMGHEAISVNYATDYFFSEQNLSNKKIAKVLNCINATKMPQNPKTNLEKIICDADLFHLAEANYLAKNKLLRIEWKNNLDLIFDDKEWYKLNIDFLSKHKYHTSYGLDVLENKKSNNIKLLNSILIKNNEMKLK